MKKILTLALALIMVLSLAACGTNSEGKPSGSIGDIGSGGAESTTGGGENSDISGTGETRVETKSDRIVTTLNDGAGNLSVTEYIYKEGVLSDIIMTVKCVNSANAKALYDTYVTGSMKEEAEQLFDDIKLDGKNVVYTYNESYLPAFSGMSMEQLAVSLDGGVPLDGSDISGNPNEEVGELTINTSWGDMNLPEGFPKLAEGVTSYIEVEGGATLSWNAMTLADLETMIEKLEDWSGLTIEKTFEADGAVAWGAENDKMVIIVNYWPDGIDMQGSISIQEF